MLALEEHVRDIAATGETMSLYESFRKHGHKVHFVDRRKSALMWTIHYSLKVLSLIIGIFGKPPLAQGDFMGTYVTTIGKTIYAHPKWTEDREPQRIDVHELCHVLQDSWRHRICYLFSAKYRLFAETEAFQAELLCFKPLLEKEMESVYWRAKHLTAYLISEKKARKALFARIDEVKAGRPTKNASLIYEIFLSSAG